jgi:hypothetical protein
MWHYQLKLHLHPHQFTESTREIFLSHAMAFAKRRRSVAVTDTAVDESTWAGRFVKRSVPIDQLLNGSEGFEILFRDFVQWHNKKRRLRIKRRPATKEETHEAMHRLAQILREGQRSGILAPKPSEKSASDSQRRIQDAKKPPLTDELLKALPSLSQAQAADALGYKSTRQIRYLLDQNKLNRTTAGRVANNDAFRKLFRVRHKQIIG